MVNKTIASLYIGNHSTLLVILERNEYNYNLLYIKKINDVLNLNETIINPDSNKAINEIGEILYKYNADYFFITLGTDYYIATNIPGNSNDNNFTDLINLSIKQQYNDKNINNFRIKSISLHLENPMELVFFISKNIILAIKNIAKILNQNITDIIPLPISIINSYIYNYINTTSENAILIQLINNIFEFIIISDKKVINIEYATIDNDIADTIETKIGQIITNYQLNPNSIYFCGENLNKQNYIECWQSCMLFDINSKRLNSMRLISCDLEKRDKEYCMNMFHIYNGCIGGAMPNKLKTSLL